MHGGMGAWMGAWRVACMSLARNILVLAGGEVLFGLQDGNNSGVASSLRSHSGGELHLAQLLVLITALPSLS